MNFMASEDEHDLIIEDLIDIKSPGRSPGRGSSRGGWMAWEPWTCCSPHPR